MSSSVYFKFKSQKEPTRVEFDGTGISVFELKRDIIIKSGLGDGTDFDLAIYTEDGKEEYDDDTTIIPRSTTVVARRLPPMKPGAGRAARYVSGKMPVNAKNASRREQTSKATAKGASNAIEQMHNAMTEEEKLSAMFVAQTEQWNAQQEEMSHQTPIFKAGGARRPANVPDHDPPSGYICYRCGEKGHWIQLCPTNDNPEFDNRPRVKRTTGIPRSFLKTVDKAAVLAQAAEDDTKAPTGIMVNADGDFVIAEPDKASWEKFQAKAKSGAAAQEVADLADKELQDRGLECPIDKKLFIDPMQTPCCEKTYCNDCITTALIESDFVCPGCQSEGVLIDNLQPDEAAEKKVEAYQKEKEAKEKTQGEAGKDAGKDAGAAPADAAASQRKASPGAASTTTNGSTATAKETSDAAQKSGPPSDAASAANSKKRPAESEAENPKIPKAPKAMQQQQQQQALANGQNGDAVNGFGMNGMNGMNGMVGDMSGMAAMNGMGMGGMGGIGMMPFAGMPMMGYGMGMSGMNGMGNMGMGMGMGMGNMNMMMGMNGAGNGYGGGYNNNNNHNNHNGRFNGGYNNGGYNNGGYNNGYGANGNYNQQGWGNRNGGYNNNGGGYNQQNRFGNNNNNNNNNSNGGSSFHQGQGGFNSHQNTNQPSLNGQGSGNGMPITNAAGAEDDAYFRKPVNPNRHFNKPKRVRPSDYHEL